MKAEFISTTNEKFQDLVGEIGVLQIGLLAIFDYDTFLQKYFHSSNFKSITYEYHDDYADITMVTKNSTYVFRV
ncbi:MAG: hypothetical protein KAI79_02200 [Bacteroidales bacterium]|nr:hypothetical protein [Bacteroidales bacterium]